MNQGTLDNCFFLHEYFHAALVASLFFDFFFFVQLLLNCISSFLLPMLIQLFDDLDDIALLELQIAFRRRLVWPERLGSLHLRLLLTRRARWLGHGWNRSGRLWRERTKVTGCGIDWNDSSRLRSGDGERAEVAGRGIDSSCCPFRWLSSASRSGAAITSTLPLHAASLPCAAGQISPRPVSAA